MRGQAIELQHPKVPEACIKDAEFYHLIALYDSLRVGKVREKKYSHRGIKTKNIMKTK